MRNVRVKICGITNVDDARVAVEAGADMLGFILYPKSPRYVEPERVREIVCFAKEERAQMIKRGHSSEIERLGDSTPSQSPNLPISRSLLCVGIFVDEPAARMAEVLDFTALDYAQLHGDEAPADFAALDGRAFKAIRPRSHNKALRDAARFAPLAPSNGPRLLIDAYDPNEYGGTGHRTDWSMARAVTNAHAGMMLAGGLTAENVAEAVRRVQPWGVDVSSGVEIAPGRKDHEKVQAFVRTAKGS